MNLKVRTIHVGVGGRGVWPVKLIPKRTDFQAVALVDVNPAALATARELTELPESACFDSMDKAIQSVEADAVIVITPPQLHAAQCLAAIKAGKHVLVEKPFTLNLREAAEIVREADARGLRVAVTQNARYAPLHVTLSRLVREKVYGKPAFALMTKFGWRPRTHHSGKVRHSYNWERAVHDFDTLRAIFNADPVRVWGHSFNPPWSPYEHGAGTYTWIEFEGGATCGCLCTFASHAGGSSFRLDCEGGTLQTVGAELHLNRPGAKQHEVVPLDAVPAPETVLLDGFHRYLTEGIEPPFGGHENLKTVALVEASGVASDESRVVDFKEWCARFF